MLSGALCLLCVSLRNYYITQRTTEETLSYAEKNCQFSNKYH
jgi:hypothetical protein